jgi:hypothetical protein
MFMLALHTDMPQPWRATWSLQGAPLAVHPLLGTYA